MAKSKGGTRGNRPTNSRPRAQRRVALPPTFGIGAGLSGGSGMNTPRQLPRAPRPTNTTPIYERGNRITPFQDRSISNYRNIEPLSTIKDPKVYREIKRSISRFESVLGIRERNIFLADMPANENGVQISTAFSRKSKVILLNKALYRLPYSEIVKRSRASQESGWHTKTNKPLGHTVTHELAHALWEYNRTSNPNAMAAQSDIVKLRNKLNKDPNRATLGYGRYGRTNTNEFWAELIVKAVHGEADDYTRAAVAIVKKYNL